MRLPSFDVGIFGWLGPLLNGRMVARTHGYPETISKERGYSLPRASYQKNNRAVFLHDGAETTLRALRDMGVHLAIVSAAPPHTLNDIQDLGLQRYFKEIYLVDTKQKEDAIREILARRNILAEKAFYVTDTPGGIEVGRKAGVFTFGFTEGYNSPDDIRKANPDQVISSLETLMGIRKPYKKDRRVLTT